MSGESSTPPGAVFLSYASQDAEAAKRICEALRSAGIEVWFDQSDLRGGDAWDQKIHNQIRDCALFMPIISANTAARHEGYFRLEWALADRRTEMIARNKAFVVPVCIDRTPDGGGDVPESFHRVQWTRLPEGATPAAFCERVAVLLGGADAANQSSMPTDPMPSIPRKRTSSHWKVLSAVVALVALVGGWRAWRTAHLNYGSGSPGTAPVATVSKMPEKSIAVLPFVDMSEKKDQEYFSDGLSEELIDHLAHSADLKVIARTSSFQFKGKNEDVRIIAEKLGVANLLEGSVRTAGHEIRITAQLIRASDGTHLWSQTYDRQMTDIFKIQDEIAGKVVQALHATLTGGTTQYLSGNQNTEAYKLLLKGEFFYLRRTKGDYDRAIDQFKRALALDPNYSLAWAKLGRTYVIKGQDLELNGTQAESMARAALQRALAIDPNSVVAHRWLARIYDYFDWNWAAAQAELDRAIALDPTGPEGGLARADLLAVIAFQTGRFEDVIQLAAQGLVRNPLDALDQSFVGWMEYLGGHLEDSAASWRKVIELAPNMSGAPSALAQVLLLLGNREEALATVVNETDELSRLTVSVTAYWALGRKTDSDNALHQLETRFADVGAFAIATAHAYRNETNATFEWLERAYRQRDPGMRGLKVEPLLRALHNDPRYKALLQKMHLPE